jgi:DNA-binding transcriptional LysR family regulator
MEALERDLGVRPFDRDRRSATLTAAGQAVLADTRTLLDRADNLRRLAADLVARTSGVAQPHVDAWVLPSHAQVTRVADGSLDPANCW